MSLGTLVALLLVGLILWSIGCSLWADWVNRRVDRRKEPLNPPERRHPYDRMGDDADRELWRR